jgi:hypothetical protein
MFTLRISLLLRNRNIIALAQGSLILFVAADLTTQAVLIGIFGLGFPGCPTQNEMVDCVSEAFFVV